MSLAQVQQLAAQTVAAVASGRNLNEVLAEQLAHHPQLTPSERGALQDMAYGCQRYLGCLKAVLRLLVPKPLPAAELEHLLLVALYQLHYSRNAPHAVVNEAVQAASVLAQGRFKNLTNAVLRRFLRERGALVKQAEREDEAKYNHPRWWVNYLRHQYPKYWHNMLTAVQKHPPLTLRVNRRRCDVEQYGRLLADQGIAYKALDAYALSLVEPMPVAQLPHFDDGWVSVQDFGAQQAAAWLQPKAGERVLDACAAPGGKSGHLLEWADCDLTAVDVDARRLQRVADNLARLGFQAALHAADAADLNAWWDGRPFDAVLADVPCTASGVVRRHPDIKWLRQPTDAAKVARQQTALLDALWSTLKPGGRMLLATCSLFVEENEQQLERFLNRHIQARCSEAKVLLPNDQQDGFYYALIHKL